MNGDARGWRMALVPDSLINPPHPVRTALPKAFIALAEGHAPSPETASSIFVHCRERLAPYKRIRRIELYELPTTNSAEGYCHRLSLSPQAARWRQRRPSLACALTYLGDF